MHSFRVFFLNCSQGHPTTVLVAEQGVVKIKRDYPQAVFTFFVKLTYFESTQRECSMPTIIA